eukprot:TRINITY_DN4312_c0_g1_i2.p1 TRINITY_DN4312_c0_g1~~TRINITY_DN4312_c0_g1_i2.p1  ORF type:complete len:847 (-),score=188.58 TRINITY_DN4312_c0_g1_i2:89-2629(-)
MDEKEVISENSVVNANNSNTINLNENNGRNVASSSSHSNAVVASNPAQSFFKSLSSIEKPGSYFVGGILLDAPNPGIEMDKNAPIKLAFPLQDFQVEKIIDVCENLTEDSTVCDLSIKNCWQLSSEQFQIANTKWGHYLRETVKPCLVKGLGIECSFSLKLIKLVLNGKEVKEEKEETEKDEKKFASLVIYLPSEYLGGEIKISHGGHANLFDFSSKSDKSAAYYSHFAAFYSECEHEIFPVSQGYQIFLVYDLIYKGKGSVAVVVNNEKAISEVNTFLNLWGSGKHSYQKLAYILEHKYSKASLCLPGLKGADLAVTSTLLQSIKNFKSPFNVYLCLMDFHIRGDEKERNIFSKNFKAENFVLLTEISESEKALVFDKVDFDASELSKTSGLGKPYKTNTFTTVNEGSTTERWYQCAAVVIWPKFYMEIVEFDLLYEKGEFVQFFLKLAKATQKFKNPQDSPHYNKLLLFSRRFLEKRSQKITSILEIFRAIEALKNAELNQSLVKTVLQPNVLFTDSVRTLVHLGNSMGWANIASELKTSFPKCAFFRPKYILEIITDPTVSSAPENLAQFTQFFPLLVDLVLKGHARTYPIQHEVDIDLLKVMLASKQMETLSVYIKQVLPTVKNWATLVILLKELSNWCAANKVKDVGAIFDLANYYHATLLPKTKQPVPSVNDLFIDPSIIKCECEHCKPVKDFLSNNQLREAIINVTTVNLRDHVKNKITSADIEITLTPQPKFRVQALKLVKTMKARQEEINSIRYSIAQLFELENVIASLPKNTRHTNKRNIPDSNNNKPSNGNNNTENILNDSSNDDISLSTSNNCNNSSSSVRIEEPEPKKSKADS